ncbi:hypothetical protein FF098_016730 [Parvularcula flava]|uniref:Secreted protein n=1 Tax=Aquisalinus luteolus TaxID=1566827 RepID=A0ABX0HND2_9PROT|nr:hypothetical protein [Aquisalinus luteolus]NHK29555.1 hypothetical protein [Aquisalinus luteolus]
MAVIVCPFCYLWRRPATAVEGTGRHSLNRTGSLGGNWQISRRNQSLLARKRTKAAGLGVSGHDREIFNRRDFEGRSATTKIRKAAADEKHHATTGLKRV